MKDLYKILHLERDCCNDDIKKSYKKLAMKYHPDRGGNETRFKEISEAYSILSDKDKRLKYDRFGYNALNNNDNISPHDIFNNIFSGFSNFSNIHSNTNVDGSITIKKVNVELDDIYNGCKKQIKITQNMKCTRCNGLGCTTNGNVICNICNGDKYIHKQYTIGGVFNNTVKNVCYNCNGRGYIIKDNFKCIKCDGKSYINITNNYTINIEKGTTVFNDSIIRKKGKYNIVSNCNEDLVIKFIEVPHNIYERHGYNLYTNKTIGLMEALTGFIYPLHLPNKKIYLNIDNIITPDTIVTVPNYGLNYKGKKGDIFIKFTIEFPNNISYNEKLTLKELFNLPNKLCENTVDVKYIDKSNYYETVIGLT